MLENRQSLDLNSLIPRPPLVSFPGLPQSHSQASPSLIPSLPYLQSHSQASPSLIPRSPLPPVSFPGLPYLQLLIACGMLKQSILQAIKIRAAWGTRLGIELGAPAMAALSNLILMLQLPCNIYIFCFLCLLGVSKIVGYFHPSGSSYRSELSW